MARYRAASYEERLTLVEHLDELRTRLIVSIVALLLASALCFWQNNLVLGIANGPLPGDRVPITFGVTEPFMTTLTLSVYGGILISLPVILYQAYAYVLPAFSPRERSAVLPFLLMIPFLFIAGVLFAYFAVLPVATKFLLNFNASEFNIEVRARDYYSFFSFTCISLGILFQIPIAIVAMTRLGIVTPERLAQNRKYAILVIAIVAMLLPGPDPVTMLIAMVPLLALFELSLLLARAFGRPPDEPAPVPAAEKAG